MKINLLPKTDWTKRIAILALSLVGIVSLGGATYAQFSGGSSDTPFGAPGLFSQVGGVVTFSDTSFQFGDSSNRIAAIYVDDLNATTATISGVVSGDLDVSGVVNVQGTATSTFAGPVSSTRFFAPGGSALLPAYTFSNDEDTGIYSAASGQINFTVGGTERFRASTASIRSSVDILPNSNNTYDLGSSSLQWFDGYFSGTVSSTDYIVGVGGQTIYKGVGSGGAPQICFDDFTDTCNDGYTSIGADSVAAYSNGTELWRQLPGQVQYTASIYPRADGGSDIGITALRWRGLVLAGTATSSALEVNTLTTATSTAKIGSATSPACIPLGDSDGAGITYLTVLNGVATFSTTPCF